MSSLFLPRISYRGFSGQVDTRPSERQKRREEEEEKEEVEVEKKGKSMRQSSPLRGFLIIAIVPRWPTTARQWPTQGRFFRRGLKGKIPRPFPPLSFFNLSLSSSFFLPSLSLFLPFALLLRRFSQSQVTLLGTNTAETRLQSVNITSSGTVLSFPFSWREVSSPSPFHGRERP